IDWLGVVLNAAVYIFYVIPFTFGGASWAWSNGRTIALIVLFGVSLILFILQQWSAFLTTTTRRLFPVDFLKRRTLVALYVATSAAASSLFVTIYNIPLYFSFARGDSGIESAVRLLPFICVVIFTVLLNGALLPQFGFYLPWYIVQGVFLTIGGSLMYALVYSP